MTQVWRMLGAAALLAAVTVAGAQTLQQTVMQKETFVRRLVDDSAFADRIAASGNRDAQAFLAAAVELYRRARDEIGRADYGAADRALNDAIWSAGKARQLAPDRMSRLIVERFEFARLMQGVESLRESYHRHLAHAQPVAGSPHAVALERADALIDDARTLAAAEDFVPAMRALTHAERSLSGGLSQLLGSRTLTYAAQFETVAEEYRYEIDRNRSYEQLVPVAVSDRRPSAEAVSVIGRHVERNQTLRTQAQSLADRKDFRAALRTLRNGTGELQQALAVAGVVVPMELPPETTASSAASTRQGTE